MALYYEIILCEIIYVLCGNVQIQFCGANENWEATIVQDICRLHGYASHIVVRQCAFMILGGKWKLRGYYSAKYF